MRCPGCFSVLRFIENCESNEGESKSSWNCDVCDRLIYIVEFEKVRQTYKPSLEEPHNKPLQHGCVCSDCGKTVTEDEYSKGDTDCCQAMVVGEEDY